MKNNIRKELIKKLKLALDEVEACPQNSSEHFYCVEHFQNALGNSVKRIEEKDNSVVAPLISENDDPFMASLISWFTPTFDWDDFVGDTDLGSVWTEIDNNLYIK